MPEVRFTRSYTVKDGSGKRYKAGEVVDLPEASANHFISRRAAVPVGAEGAAPEAEAGEGDGLVEIPEDWAALSWSELRALASQVSGEDIRKKDEALAAIEAELESRAAAD